MAGLTYVHTVVLAIALAGHAAQACGWANENCCNHGPKCESGTACVDGHKCTPCGTNSGQPACNGGSIKLYENYNFGGRELHYTRNANKLKGTINDLTSSVIVESGTWQIFRHWNYEGESSILGPGRYQNPAAMGLTNNVLSSLRLLDGSIKLYEHYNFGGRELHYTGNENKIKGNINDIISSVIVESGTWQIFKHWNYKGESSILGPGRYKNPAAMGLTNDVLSSLRLVDSN